MQETVSMDALQAARGRAVIASDGEKIGAVEELFFDNATGDPEWIGIGTGLFGTKRVLVPVERAELADEGLYVPFSKDHVKASPDVDSDEISQETERELYAYYGLEYSEQRSETVLPEGPAESTSAAQGVVTRSEEELRVGTREEQAGRARLRKWVETEPVETEVELQRETARVTREPVNQVVTGSEISEDEVEVTLSEERPVVQKQTVAKERIGLEKEVETRRETVSDEVRKERVDVEGDVRR